MKTIGDREFYSTLEEVIDPAHTAVLVIDQQNDFCHPRGYYAEVMKLDVSMTQGMNDRINQLTRAARSHGVMVIFTQFFIAKGFTSDSPMWLALHAGAGLKSLEQERFYTVEGTWGAELYEKMEVEDGDHVIKKLRGSAFVRTPLEDLLKKNADMLKMGTINTAKEAERSIIDVETLQHTNEQLISTLDEVLTIQHEGAEKRKAAEVELGRIEGELKKKLMELRS